MWVRSARACTLQLWGLSHTKDYGNVQQLSLTILTTPEIGKYKHGNSCRIQSSKYQVYLHFQQAATTRSMYKPCLRLPCHSVPFPTRSPDLHATTNVVARGVWRVASGKPHPDVTLDIHFPGPRRSTPISSARTRLLSIAERYEPVCAMSLIHWICGPHWIDQGCQGVRYAPGTAQNPVGQWDMETVPLHCMDIDLPQTSSRQTRQVQTQCTVTTHDRESGRLS
jgi:hypothetical protein